MRGQGGADVCDGARPQRGGCVECSIHATGGGLCNCSVWCGRCRAVGAWSVNGVAGTREALQAPKRAQEISGRNRKMGTARAASEWVGIEKAVLEVLGSQFFL
jgi:hypothetical protein